MISFIIIGRNEGWKLSKCFESIFQAIGCNNSLDSEVIYIDSQSTDNSLERARKFESIKIFEITGECNAAIARNIGAKEAKGEVLFFIDGDMEIEESFLNSVLKKKHELQDYCLTGHLDDYFYTVDGNFIDMKPRNYKKKFPRIKKVLPFTGGIFLIRKENWNKVDGMRTKYKRSQDLDLFLRLSKRGIKVLRLPKVIAKHHTVDYNNKKRMWSNLSQGYIFFSSMLFRDHILDRHSLIRVLRSKYTSILFFISIITSVVNFTVFLYSISIYGGVVTIRVYLNTKRTSTNDMKFLYAIKRWIYQLVADIIFWIGIILFWPAPKSENYRKIQ